MKLDQDADIITEGIANKGNDALSHTLVIFVMNFYALVHAAKDDPANKDILANANIGLMENVGEEICVPNFT